MIEDTYSDGAAMAKPMSPALVSVEAEQSVLGSLLLDNGAFDRVGDVLRPEHFADQVHSRIWVAISAMLIANKPADVFTVHDRLRSQGDEGDLSYLNALVQSIASAANCRRYAEIVLERYKARQLMAVGVRAVEIAQDAQTPINDRIEQMQSAIAKLSEQAAEREAVSIDAAMVRAIDRLNERAEGNARVIPTGLHDLDEMLGGGLRPGNVAVLGARPSHGKTALAMTIGLSVAEQRPVGFLSMEMSEGELTDRVFANAGRIDMRDVQRPPNGSSQVEQNRANEFWERVTEATEKACRLKLFIDDQGGLTLHQVAAKARGMLRKHGLQALVVDYLQLMSGTDSKLSRAYQLEEIMRGLKALAKALDIAVIVLAQVNRKVEGMPGLPDLKDSGAIEQDADVVLFIHRPVQDDPSLEGDWKYYAAMRVAKNRQGRTGDIDLSYIGHETRFAGWSGARPQKSATKRRESDL